MDRPHFTVGQPTSADRIDWSRAFSTPRHPYSAEPLTLRRRPFVTSPLGLTPPAWPRPLSPTAPVKG